MPTMNDIAKMAGLSKSAVSLALSDHPRISEETKKKVRQIAHEIGYVPNRLAAGLSNAKSRSIGVVFFDSNSEGVEDFFKQILVGISHNAVRHDYNVVFIGISQAQYKKANFDITKVIARTGVDGTIFINSNPKIYNLKQLMKNKLPMAFVGKRSVQGMEINYVASDNHGGGKKATEYLISLGHQRICLALPPKEERFPWEEDRIDGYFSALRNAGITPNEHFMFNISTPFNPEDECWKQFSEHPVTAVFAITPAIGIAVLQYFRHIGAQVPRDMSLIVFDNFSTAANEQPPITVIKQDMESIGETSIQCLLDILEDPSSSPKQILLPTQLVERASCAPPQNLITK